MLAMMHRVTKLALVLAAAAILGAQDRPVLKRWERGIVLESRKQPGMAMYLWFYEWNMFDAVAPGQHTPGSHRFLVTVDRAGSAASIDASMLKLGVTAVPGGAALTVVLANRTAGRIPAESSESHANSNQSELLTSADVVHLWDECVQTEADSQWRRRGERSMPRRGFKRPDARSDGAVRRLAGW
jgi:hypothetical protein